MNMPNHIKIFIICLLSAVQLGGCSAISLWERNPTYTDSIDRFLATEDGKKLVFIGEKYHYIFDGHKSLRKILLWKDRELLDAKLDEKFIVDSSNNISGNLRVICKCKNATKTQISWIENIGFKKAPASSTQFDEKEILNILEIQLSGVRYLAKDLALDKYAKLNKPYTVVIEEPKSTAGVIGRVMLTPIVVAADGIVTIGMSTLFVMGLPSMLVDPEFNK